jgi:putative tricarboxylic transport membrane protein
VADKTAHPVSPSPVRTWGNNPDLIGGVIAVLFGMVAIAEAARLYHLRTGPLVGDHAMPGVVGILLVIFGILLVVRRDRNASIEKFPAGAALARLVGSFGLLLAYWGLMDWIGYLASTFVVTIGLFKVMSQYGWIRSILYAAIVSVVVGYLFINLLNIALPSGIVGFG